MWAKKKSKNSENFRPFIILNRKVINKINSFLSAVRENDLEKYFHVNHRVIRAIWEEETSKWYLTLRSNDDPSTDFEDWCDFFIK